MSIALSHEPFVRWHLWQPCYFEVHTRNPCRIQQCHIPTHWVKVSDSILSPMDSTMVNGWVPTRYEPAGTSVTV